MNREKVLVALSALGKSGAVCYVYRESVFELLSCGRVDGTLYLLSDLGSAKLKAVLEKGGYKISRTEESASSPPASRGRRWRFDAAASGMRRSFKS